MCTGYDTMIMRPFFTFFGGKWRSAPYYPEPQNKTIIELFAGSAGYSMNYYDREIILIEKDHNIASIWKFLIQSTPDDIMSLPDIVIGQTVDSLDVPEGARNLIGFWCGRGRTVPGKRITGWGKGNKYSRYYWGLEAKRRIASQVDRIRHWTIIEDDYTKCLDLNSESRTWFVDPPYKGIGQYRLNYIDYRSLAAICFDLNGQTIICEGEYGDWIPFQPFYYNRSNNGRTSLEKICILESGTIVELE